MGHPVDRDDMTAGLILEHACREGRLLRIPAGERESHAAAARTYLPDGTLLTWHVPAASLPGVAVTTERSDQPGIAAGSRVRVARLALDAEPPLRVRPALLRRYGISDPVEFALLWTRAEALAKLADTPIIRWLSRYALTLPDAVNSAQDEGLLAWVGEVRGDVVVTRACSVKVPGRGLQDD